MLNFGLFAQKTLPLGPEWPKEIQETVADIEYCSYMAGYVYSLIDQSADRAQVMLFLSTQIYAKEAWISVSGQRTHLGDYPEIKEYAAMLERHRCCLLGKLRR